MKTMQFIWLFISLKNSNCYRDFLVTSVIKEAETKTKGKIINQQTRINEFT